MTDGIIKELGLERDHRRSTHVGSLRPTLLVAMKVRKEVRGACEGGREKRSERASLSEQGGAEGAKGGREEGESQSVSLGGREEGGIYIGTCSALTVAAEPSVYAPG